MARAAIYTRISKVIPRGTDDDPRNTEGVDRQAEQCRALVDRAGHTLVGTYTDNDVSAYGNKPRPEYRRLLDDVRAGLVDVIVCWHTDRLYRRLADLETLVDVCNQHDVTIETVQGGGLDLNTATGRMLAGILATQSKYEVDHQIERQKAAHASRAAAGRYRGGPVSFGFKTVPGKPGYLEHDPAEADAVRYAAGAILEGVSLKAIAREWIRRGVVEESPKSGFEVAKVRKRMLSPRVAGLEPYKGEVYPATTYKAILDESTWRAVKAVLEDPARRVSTGTDRKHLLTGVARCGVCGHTVKTLKRGRVDSDDTRSYVCGKCHKVSRLVRNVDAVVVEVLFAYLERPENRLTISEKNDDGKSLQGLLDERRAIQARQNELAGLFADGAVSAAQLRTATAKLDAKLDDLNTKIAAVSATSPVASLVLGDGDMRDRWERMTPDQRTTIVDSLFTVTILPTTRKGRVFDPSTIKITEKGNQ